jgi:transcription elongation GreA/GreB family factor
MRENIFFTTMKITLSQARKIELKRSIKAHCTDLMQQRLNNIQQAMQNAQESANSEEKSSAGDKYEVGRAMGHLELEMLSKQLNEAEHDLSIINALNPDLLYDEVTAGSIVISDDVIFFILLGLGSITINDQKIIVLSPVAPLSMALLQKRRGDKFVFNKKTLTIQDVF